MEFKEGQQYYTASSGWITLTAEQAATLNRIISLLQEQGLVQYHEGQGWGAYGLLW